MLFRSLTSRRMKAALEDAGALAQATENEVQKQAAKQRTCGEVHRLEVAEYERAKAAADKAAAAEAGAVARYVGLSAELCELRGKMEAQRRHRAELEHKLALLEVLALEGQRRERLRTEFSAAAAAAESQKKQQSDDMSASASGQRRLPEGQGGGHSRAPSESSYQATLVLVPSQDGRKSVVALAQEGEEQHPPPPDAQPPSETMDSLFSRQ